MLKRDMDGFEWKLEDGQFWKREAVNLDEVAEEPEWIRADPVQRVRTDLGEKEAPISEEARCVVIERMACDEWDMVVKHIFFDKGIRERGVKLATGQPAQVSVYDAFLIECSSQFRPS